MASETPAPIPGAARDLRFPVAQEADLMALGLPVAPPPDWRPRFLTALALALKRHRALRLALDSCLRCGACLQRCPFFLGTGDPLNTPAGRAELMRSVYRRHLAPDPTGPLARRGSLKELDEALLASWYAYFHQCSLCRRCAVYCPQGIDTSQITLAARQVLAELGLVPDQVGRALGHLYRTGNHLQLAPPVLSERLMALEDQLKAETGQEVRCPVDELGAEVLLIIEAEEIAERPQALMAYAKMFHAAGLTWTLSTYLTQASNFGEYVGYRHMRLINRRAVQAAESLRVQYVVWGESGQGWAVARNRSDTLSGPWAGLERLKLKAPLHVHQLTLDLLERGAFLGKLDRDANRGWLVTYHDPCLAARGAGLLSEPRALLKAACPRVAEMPANTTGERTLCCGAGGGLRSRVRPETALAGLAPRARVLEWMQRERKVNLVATACQTCRAWLAEGVTHYGMTLPAAGVMELFGQALMPTPWPEGRP
jgi:Fe-S oxidoreductase